MQANNNIRYSAQDVLAFATQLLEKAGLANERAAVVAETLLEADLMGHSTHGLALLSPYLGEIEKGSMKLEGEPIVVADAGSAVTWDGQYLPGPWLVRQALELAFERISQHPLVTVSIRRSHHIASLASYPKIATDKGLFVFMCTSDPRSATVAPYGGLKPVYTPNPIGVGIPTKGDPIIIDVSMSTTANGLVARYRSEGKMLPQRWLFDSHGNASDDPSDLYTDPPGSVMPLGGIDLGYKGFALGIMVEALTSALAGYGRAEEPNQWGAGVFLQVINPEAFGGLDAFVNQTEWLAEACRTNPTRAGKSPVRLPGQRGLQLRAEQLDRGVVLYPSIMPALVAWAEKLLVSVPTAM